jgi:hypothetical protein
LVVFHPFLAVFHPFLAVFHPFLAVFHHILGLCASLSHALADVLFHPPLTADMLHPLVARVVHYPLAHGCIESSHGYVFHPIIAAVFHPLLMAMCFTLSWLCFTLSQTSCGGTLPPAAQRGDPPLTTHPWVIFFFSLTSLKVAFQNGLRLTVDFSQES